jgi:hypothetical protein
VRAFSCLIGGVDSTDVVVKTPKGAEELRHRSLKLPQRLRTMLIMIDGSLNAGQLIAAGATLGVPADFLDNLLQQGLIAVRPSGKQPVAAAVQAEASESDRFRAAQKFMNDTVVDALGFRAFFFTLKLEKCFTRAELTGLIEDYTKAITRGSGAEVALALRARASELLS